MGSLRETIRQVKPCVVCVLIAHGDTIIGKGSGFVCGSGGLIATCNHVVSGATGAARVLVKMPAHAEPLRADVTLSDPERDIAILQVELKDLAYMELGSYDDVAEGDLVAFCGYPLALSIPTTHVGIVSAKGKGIIPGLSLEVLQIDASINSGNSGCPLFLPENGLVVGVVNAKYGSISQALKSIAEMKEPPSRVVIMGLDFVPTMNALVRDMEKNLQLGIGYAISVDYLKEALRQLDKTIL